MKLTEQEFAQQCEFSVVISPQSSQKIENSDGPRYDSFLLGAIYKPHAEKASYDIPLNEAGQQKEYCIDIKQLAEDIQTMFRTAVEEVSKHDDFTVEVVLEGGVSLDTKRYTNIAHLLIKATRQAVKKST